MAELGLQQAVEDDWYTIIQSMTEEERVAAFEGREWVQSGMYDGGYDVSAHTDYDEYNSELKNAFDMGINHELVAIEVEEVEDSEDIGIGGGGIAVVEQPIKPVPGPWAPFSIQVAVHIRKQKKAFAPPPPPQARKQFAEKVVSEYDKVIGNTTDLFYHNGVMRTNSQLFKVMFKVGLDILSTIKYYDEPKYEGQLLSILKNWVTWVTDSVIPYRARITIEAKNQVISAEAAAVAGATAYPMINIIQEGLEIIIRLIAPLISKEEERQEWLNVIDRLEEIELEKEAEIQAEVEDRLTEAKSAVEQAKELNANDAALDKATEAFKKELDARREQLK